jgi:hypothetical protein
MSEASISLTTYIKDLIDWITGTISSSTSNQSMHASVSRTQALATVAAELRGDWLGYSVRPMRSMR